jgi:uncharacterized SAM-binding protein YcdF (DUF218 family)
VILRAAGVSTLAVLVAVLGLAGTTLVVSRPVPAPDAVVVLASHEWERLPAALALLESSPKSRVLLTTPRLVSEHRCFDCAGRVGWLGRAGVDPKRIVRLADVVDNTYGEALAVRRYALGHGLRTVLIVTSPYHTRRAVRTFDTVFAATGVAIGVAPARSVARPAWWWVHAYDRRYVGYEWAALAAYRAWYGVWLVP